MADRLRAIVCEDEPQIRRSIVRRLERYCVVVGEAADGSKCMDMLPRLAPDVVFTDIRMPVMDGLELARRVRQCDARISVVIVSGYSDFELARKALRYGVTDYLLKPPEEIALQQVFRQLGEVHGSASEHRILVAGESFSGTERRGMTLLCLGNLDDADPGLDWSAYAAQCASDGDWAILRGASPNFFIVYGLQARRLFDLLCAAHPPVTAIRGDQLPDMLKQLSERLVLGASQWLEPPHQPLMQEDALIRLVRAKLNDIVFSSGDHEGVRKETELLTGYVLSQTPPQRTLEHLFELILHRLELAHPVQDRALWQQRTRELSQSISRAADYASLEAPFLRCCELIYGNTATEADRFRELIAYVDEHFATSLTLDELSTRFNYNYAYVSRMFKKLAGMSLTRYMTKKRIEMAKRLLAGSMHINQIAMMVGFEDAHYFRRVFKVETGQTPADYRRQHR